MTSSARTLGRISAFAAMLACAARGSAAQECVTTQTRTAPSGISNAVIRSVTVKTDAPISLPIGGSWLSSLRRTTETGVVQRQLLFEPNQRVDTLLVAQTLRRLRDRRIYADVLLAVTRCAGSDSVDMLVTTRDAWTLQPIARIVPPSTVSIGAEDRNILGSGRSLAVTNDQSASGHGGSFSALDPWMFGRDVIGSARFADIAGNHLLRVAVRHPEVNVDDPWRVEMGFGRQRYGDSRASEHPLGNLFLEGSIGHIIGNTEFGFTVPYVGAELDHAQVLEILRGDDGEPEVHRRQFVGLDFGILRRAAQFDTASWFAGGRGFLDIPLRVESDVLIGVGDDRAQHAAAVRYDAWAGRMWMPHRGSLLGVDAWTSGYIGDVRLNHIDRASVSAYTEAPRGYWGARMMFEQLLELDPDQRMLTLANANNDASYAAVPKTMRGADRAWMTSAERAWSLFPVGRASMLDAAVYSAGSVRWDSPQDPGKKFGVALVGARLRLLSANGSIGSTRVDVGFPIASNGSIVHRPLVSVSVSSLFDSGRGRDGRRRHQ
ncbi:MAG: hypothetical protein ABI442_02650 [Gemmatimonadaceae bacterium]